MANDKDKSPNQSPFLTSTNLTSVIPPQIPLLNQSSSSSSTSIPTVGSPSTSNANTTTTTSRFSPRLLNPNANPFEFRPTSPPTSTSTASTTSNIANLNPNNLIPPFQSLNSATSVTTTSSSSNSFSRKISLSPPIKCELIPYHQYEIEQDPPNLTAQQKATIIRKHLLNAEDQQKALISESLLNSTSSSSPRIASGSHWGSHHQNSAAAALTQTLTEPNRTGGESSITIGGVGSALGEEEDYPTPYNLQGGDIVAPIYKWVQQQSVSGSYTDSFLNGPGGGLRRSRSLISLPDASANASAISGMATGITSRKVSTNSRNELSDELEILDREGQEGGEEEAEEFGDNGGLNVKEILEPGGFRRDFVIRRMVSRGDLEPPSSSTSASTPSAYTNISNNNNYYGTNNNESDNENGKQYTSQSQSYRRRGNGTRLTRSFIDFLSLYGHFGGEDLEEIEEEEDDSDDLEDREGSGDYEEEEEEDEDLWDEEDNRIPAYRGTGKKVLSSTTEIEADRTLLPHERTSLLRRSLQKSTSSSCPLTDSINPPHPSTLHRQHSRKRSSSVGQSGDATVTQAVLMLLKSFVGTGVLFLGKAFYNGGILFSTIVLCGIAMVSLYSFLLLVETRLVVHGSFGDIGGMLYGKYMRWMILFSIVLSQIGFVAAYTIFVAQNLQAFFMAVTKCSTYVPIAYLILGQLVIFLPLAMIRNIQKLSGTALIADAFILFGLVYIFSNEIGVLVDQGLADVKLFNPNDFPLLIGTAVFSFEGIGLVIPITESMKDPHQFPRVLTGVMIGVMFLFAGAGILAYAAYGSAIQTVVFVNLPQDDKFVNVAQFLYSIAILLSTPLQLFPAVRIMENGIFSKSGKFSYKVKWEKNLFRAAVVVGSAGVAWAGASDLDKFVSLIGSVACVPLCFCYPALLHYKACATTRKQKLADVALFIFGVLAAVYTTSQTIKLLTSGDPGGKGLESNFGGCPPRG